MWLKLEYHCWYVIGQSIETGSAPTWGNKADFYYRYAIEEKLIIVKHQLSRPLRTWSISFKSWIFGLLYNFINANFYKIKPHSLRILVIRINEVRITEFWQYVIIIWWGLIYGRTRSSVIAFSRFLNNKILLHPSLASDLLGPKSINMWSSVFSWWLFSDRNFWSEI